MTRLNIFADEPWDRTAEKTRIRTRLQIGKVAVSTRSNPFEPVPEGGDKGIVAMFDIPDDK